MPLYRHLLVPLDLDGLSRKVLDTAIEVGRLHGAAITLLHVVEYVPIKTGASRALPSSLDVTSEVAEQAGQRLNAISLPDDVAVRARRVEIGRIKSQILRVANEHDVDLVIIGSHQRHGLALLVNYTEDAVLHCAPCDVLAVRLPDA